MNKKSHYKNFQISVACGLLICFCCSLVSFGASCKDIRSRVLRLHVLANSDSKIDQCVKLKVRDAVLNAGNTIFEDCMSVEEAKTKLLHEKQKLEDAANQVLKENDMPYQAKISMEDTFFTTRTYEETATLPAGHYMAIRVVLGDGNGHNWWCVMFPPVCLPAASDAPQLEDVLNEQETLVVTQSQKYEIRFKMLEIFEKILEKAK